ncbi:FMRFamide peptide receptor frpr-18-like [Tubulanus polymorphus]|uniref:FMRFamide peptide receptor frpr-18-like n=1 Tax=Tubulanus polymorphus TaxID=672921 RepID=UPI003DA3F312
MAYQMAENQSMSPLDGANGTAEDAGQQFYKVWVLNSSLSSGVWWTSYIAQVYLLGAIDIVGIFFNILSFLTLLNEEGKLCSQNVLLMGLSVADGLYLIGNFFTFPVGAIYVTIKGDLTYHAFVSRYVLTPFFITRVLALYMVVLVTFDRFIAVYYPLKSALYCTVNGAVIQIVVLVVAAVLVEVIPRYGWTALIKDPLYNVHMYNGHQMVIHCFLPVLFVFIFNSFIIRALRNSRRVSGKTNDTHTALTKRLLVVSTAFLCCALPVFLEGIMVEIVHHAVNPAADMAFNFVLLLSIICVAFNCGMNLILYYLTGARFRNSFARMFVNPCLRTFKKRPQIQSHVQLTTSFTATTDISSVA